MNNSRKTHFFVDPNVCIRVTYRRGKARLSISNVTETYNKDGTDQNIFVLDAFAVDFTKEQLIKFVQLAPNLISALDALQKSNMFERSFAYVMQSAAEGLKADNGVLDKQNKVEKDFEITDSSEKSCNTNVSIATQTEEKSENLNKNPLLSDIVQRIKTKNKSTARPSVLMKSALPQKRKTNTPKDTPTAEIKKKRPMKAMKKDEMERLCE